MSSPPRRQGIDPVTNREYTLPAKQPKSISGEVRVFYRLSLIVILLVACACAQQATLQTTPSAAPTIPDTPAGRTFKAWLDSFNSGDRPTMEAYYHKYQPDRSVEQEIRFRDMTGGFELLKIMKSEPRHIEFLVKERHGDNPGPRRSRGEGRRSRGGNRLCLAGDSARNLGVGP